ncbi:SAVMC3_10250 family protein [Streptomyces sp. NPDC057271]|uniref:SAVMC3_10250 family protein n=1 Tax=unclassified Streptomyces TaxID=2593676 RepID=UPI00363AC6D7
MSEFREFVYLSDGKLRQFARPRRFTRPGAVRLTTPVGGVDVEASAADAEHMRMQRLREVDQHLAERARWFAEPGLRPGQWVWFEASLHCVTLHGGYQRMVLFADPAPGDEPRPEEETGCRLLLHGSTRHLVGYAPATIDGPALEDIDGGSSIGTTFLTTAGQAVRALSTEPDPTADGAPVPGVGLSGSGVRDLIAAIDARHADLSASTRMCGFARVTAELPAGESATRCLIASPLSVEYARDQA